MRELIFEKIKSEGLAHNSYFIGSEGEATVIDPRRDVRIYLRLARKYEVAITHIFETHRNEDYVIGSKELAQFMDAQIYHGTHLDFAYGQDVKEGDSFTIGSLDLEILETPGHTPESISITVKDTAVSRDVYMVFTGDVLFAGEVGRTDFYEGEKRREMSEKLYESITRKILPLGDSVIVCPAHGGGSVCGGAIGDFEFTTIGYEKQTNPLLQKSKEEFIEYKTKEKLHLPPYFRQMEKYNKEGPPLLHGLPHLKAVSVAELKNYRKKGGQIVDIRGPVSFAGGHVPGSLNIWRNGLASYIGWVLNYEDPIFLIDDYNLDLNAVVRTFIRLGFDNVKGYLAEGISAWLSSGERIGELDILHVGEVKEMLGEESIFILDVGNTERWKEGHIKGATYIYVGNLEDQLGRIPKEKKIIVYCESGFKTSVAASILKQHGYDVGVLAGGWNAWKAVEYPIETT